MCNQIEHRKQLTKFTDYFNKRQNYHFAKLKFYIYSLSNYKTKHYLDSNQNIVLLFIRIDTDSPESEVVALVDRVLEKDTFFLALRDAQSVKTNVSVID